MEARSLHNGFTSVGIGKPGVPKSMITTGVSESRKSAIRVGFLGLPSRLLPLLADVKFESSETPEDPVDVLMADPLSSRW